MRGIPVLLVGATLLLGGCTQVYVPPFIQVYQPDIQQGNVLTAEEVEQLRPGMSRSQVRALLGSPVMETVFHADRWIYIYYDKPGKKKPFKHRLAVYFDNDRVAHVEQVGDPLPVDEQEIGEIHQRGGH